MPKELTPERVGQRIREAMKTAELRPEAVAAEIGASRDTIDRYMKGQTSPNAIDLWKIARVTGMPFGWFAGEDEMPIPEQLDRIVIARLLDALEQRTRATEATVNELRLLLTGS